MRPFRKIYLEITSVCNLRCTFCPPTQRPGGFLTPEVFRRRLEALKGWGTHLYFHLKGEPLLHPRAVDFLVLAGQAGFQVNLTTNGTLLDRLTGDLGGLRQVNVSLQSWEDPSRGQGAWEKLNAWLDRRPKEVLTSLRYWTHDPKKPRESVYFWDKLRHRYPHLGPDLPTLTPGFRGLTLEPGVYLSLAQEFLWPGDGEGEEPPATRAFCKALRDQIGVLWDGTVVPCCLDGEGGLALGNLDDQPLEAILAGPRATNIHRGFSEGRAVEDQCKRCDYRLRFS